MILQQRQQLPAERRNIVLVDKEGGSRQFRQAGHKVLYRHQLVFALPIDQAIPESKDNVCGMKFQGGFQFYLNAVFFTQDAEPAVWFVICLPPEPFAGTVDVDGDGTVM